MKRVLLLGLLMFSHRASASVDATTSPATCTVKGKVQMPVPVWSAPIGGVQLLQLAYQDRNVEAFDFPTDSSIGRVHTRSSRDVPGLRVDGWVYAKTLTFSAARDQPVIVNHVWLTAGASLRLYQTPNALEGDAYNSPMANTRTRIDCADLRFGGSGTPAPPKGELMYFKNKSTKLLDGPAGKPVFTIDLLRDTVDVVSVKTQGLFRSIEVVDVVKVSGWVANADLVTQPSGDYAGSLGLSGVGTYGNPSKPSFVAKYDTEVYLDGNGTGPVAAILEKDARVFATPVANGYSTITLYNHDASPPDNKSFYVLTSALQ